MSIYGPPTPPPRDHARRASARVTRLVLGVIILGALVYVGVLALLEFSRHSSSERLEVERAAAIEIDRRRDGERLRLQTAELMPSLPAPPDTEIPAPPELQTAAPLSPPQPSPPSQPSLEAAQPLELQVAEPLSPSPSPPPERLQTAEILR